MSDSGDLPAGPAEVVLEGPGGVELVAAAEGLVTCRATWGGWQWEAQALDAATALDRLRRRITMMSPFDGADADWGPAGYLADPAEDLDPSIPEPIRRLMVEYDAWRTQQESAAALKHMSFASAARPAPPSGGY